MHLIFAFFILVSLHNVEYPTTGWIPCISEGEICNMGTTDLVFNNTHYFTPTDHNSILTRYGDGQNFIYKEMNRLSNAFRCDDVFFGDPGGTDKFCEYKIINNTAPSGGDINLDKYESYLIPDGEIRYINYGCGPISYVTGWVYLQDEFLGPTVYYDNKQDIHQHKMCGGDLSYVLYKEDSTYRFGKFRYAAIEGSYFTLPSKTKIYNIMFGTLHNRTISTLIYYSSGIITKVSGERFWCGPDTLAHLKVYYSDFPKNQRTCMYSEDSMFGNTQGYWKSVGSCSSDDCTLTYTLAEGVINTDGSSISTSYAESMAGSTSEHMNFFGLGASHSMTTTTSNAITNLVSSSYSKQYSRSSTVSCKGKVLFQWLQETDEACLDLWCKTYVYTLNYLCTSTFSEPQCPLTACLDSDCQKCSDY